MTIQQIFEVIAQDDLAALKRLLAADPGLVRALHASSGLHHWTTPQFSAAKGEIEACRMFVEREAKVFARANNCGA